jgi:hypothetical protein
MGGASLLICFAAQGADCVATFQSATGLLTMEAVQVGDVRYSASEQMLPNTTTLVLESATPLTASGCTRPVTYSDGTVDLPNVSVDGTAYSARLSLVAASSPLRFTVASAVPLGSNTKLVGSAGIAAWDALAQSERNRVTSWNSLFIHQSVGQDMEDGTAINGFKAEYFAPGMLMAATNLYGGLFDGISNGDPTAKFSYFRSNALANKANLRLAVFKFGYADIESGTLNAVQLGYKAMVDELKSNGIRVLHVTPPLIFDTNYNTPKMQLRSWMQTTFPDDVIFDLQDIESRTHAVGARCEQNGVWQICSDIRSTPVCPSKGQGIDTVGQGHLCLSAAVKISKAFLYALYLAGK